MTDIDRAELVDALARLHSSLMVNARNIVPAGEDYQAVSALSGAIIEAIRRLTGKEPAWMHVTPSAGGTKWGT